MWIAVRDAFHLATSKLTKKRFDNELEGVKWNDERPYDEFLAELNEKSDAYDGLKDVGSGKSLEMSDEDRCDAILKKLEESEQHLADGVARRWTDFCEDQLISHQTSGKTMTVQSLSDTVRLVLQRRSLAKKQGQVHQQNQQGQVHQQNQQGQVHQQNQPQADSKPAKEKCDFCNKRGHTALMCFNNPQGQNYKPRSGSGVGAGGGGNNHGGGGGTQTFKGRCYNCNTFCGNIARNCPHPKKQQQQQLGQNNFQQQYPQQQYQHPQQQYQQYQQQPQQQHQQYQQQQQQQ